MPNFTLTLKDWETKEVLEQGTFTSEECIRLFDKYKERVLLIHYNKDGQTICTDGK